MSLSHIGKGASAVLSASLLVAGLSACEPPASPLDPNATPAVDASVANRPKPLAAALAVPPGSVAVVNGKLITKAAYDLYAETRQRERPLERQATASELLNELINLELLSQQAVAQGLDKQPQIVNQVQFQRDSILAGAMIERLAGNFEVSEEEIGRYYAQNYASPTRREYKTRNILVAKEEEARAVIAELAKGGEFAELAREKSIGPAASKGGALSWFKPEDVLKEFAEAVAALDKGEYTKTPVRTTYGWHVILLEEHRPLAAPPLEEVRESIQLNLISQRLDDYIDELRSKAQIQER